MAKSLKIFTTKNNPLGKNLDIPPSLESVPGPVEKAVSTPRLMGRRQRAASSGATKIRNR